MSEQIMNCDMAILLVAGLIGVLVAFYFGFAVGMSAGRKITKGGSDRAMWKSLAEIQDENGGSH